MSTSPDLLQTRRGRIAAAAAVVVHASLVLAALRGDRKRLPDASAPIESIEITVEHETQEVAADPARDRAPAPATAAGAIALRPASGGGARASASEAPASIETPAAPAAAASGAPVMLFVPSPSAAPIGALAPNPFLGRDREGSRGAPASTEFHSAAPEAPSPAEAKRAAEAALRSDRVERDAALGLGPEGPVVTALKDATRGSRAPERGSATFLAVVDAAGIVVSLRLVGSTGGDGWPDARDRAARSLAGARLKLRGSKGAELTIVVESDVLLPSGAKPSAPVRPALSDSKIVIPENAPSGGTADVVKTYTVGKFDLSDVGAGPRRVVRARLVSISTL